MPLRALKQEWKQLVANKMLLLTVVVLMFIPIIYAGIITSSYWDPYGSTAHLPVAVVNEDEPAVFEGRTLHIGDDLVENLKTNNDLEWHFVSREEADRRFADGDYYMVVTIPATFSQHAATVMDETPQRMELRYAVNPGRNFFSETIGRQATTHLNHEISKSITEEYTRAIFTQIQKIGDGLADASSGADKLSQGADKLVTGNRELTGHLQELAKQSVVLADGATSMQSGVDALSDGVRELSGGAAQLDSGIAAYTDGVQATRDGAAALTDTDKGVPRLAAGQSELQAALQQLQSGSAELNRGLRQVQDGLPAASDLAALQQGMTGLEAAAAQLSEAIAQSEDASPELKTQAAQLAQTMHAIQPKAVEALGGYEAIGSALADQLIPGSSALSDGLSGAVAGGAQLEAATQQLNEQAPKLGDALEQLAAKSDQLKLGSSQLLQGMQRLSGSLPALDAGAGQLADGSHKLSDAAARLAQGSTELGEGLGELDQGAGELASRLQEGSDTARLTHPTEDNYDMIATPVEVTEQELNAVPNYGHALAPNFMSLALFIGAFSFNLIFPIRKPALPPTSGVSWWLSKFSVGFVQATSGALILSAIMIWGLGLQVAHTGLFVAVAILSALAYMFLVMLLNITLGNPGRFIAMLLLVLQLAASGGTFPTELQNGFFQAINPYLPMTYAIYGFREAMTSAMGADVLLTSVGVLIGCIVVFNLALLLYMHLTHTREARRFDEATAS